MRFKPARLPQPHLAVLQVPRVHDPAVAELEAVDFLDPLEAAAGRGRTHARPLVDDRTRVGEVADEAVGVGATEDHQASRTGDQVGMEDSGVVRLRRFVCPRTGSVSFTDGGYLADPEGPYGRFRNPDLCSLEETMASRCVVLLGEPGLGKSTAFGAYGRELEQSLDPDDALVRVDLAEYGSEDRLIRDVFESEELDRWRRGSHQLHLLLDSLDECRLYLRQVATLLARRIERSPADRLWLRVVCRTADWPAGLEAAMRAKFGEDQVGVFELVPLRRDDVRAVARSWSVDVDAFLTAVDHSQAVPLANRPLTLKLLLRRFQQSAGSLPADQVELYAEGMLSLCDEQSPSRRDAGLLGELSPEQRVAVAERLAALTIFCGVTAFWTGPLSGEMPDTDLPVDRCAGGFERIQSGRFDVTASAVRETVGTGLLSSRGEHRLGWVHQSYAEFLAARYLDRRQLADVQLRSLLSPTVDIVVPQLRAVAAWLLAIAPTAVRPLITSDPTTFLDTGVRVLDPTLRAELVGALLEMAGEGRLRRRLGRDLRGLAHDGLPDQLRPILTDRSASESARSLAIDIAEACQASALGPWLLAIALDGTEPLRLRLDAGYAITRIGDDELKRSLRPLALGEAGPDLDNELKGIGLRAAWPLALTIAEVLTILTPPKASLIGAYYMFLVQDFPDGFRAGHLSEVLPWAARQEQAGAAAELGAFGQLIDRVVLLAWQHLDMPDVASQLAELVLERLHRHYKILVGARMREVSFLASDARKRRLLLTAILERLQNPQDVYLLDTGPDGVATPEDFQWLIERHDQTQDPTVRSALKNLVMQTFDVGNEAHREAVVSLDRGSDLYQEAFRFWVEPIDLTSEHAARLRAAYRKTRRIRSNDEPPGPSIEELRARILGLLDALEAGDTAAWWQCNRILTVEPGSNVIREPPEDDLTRFPGWQLLAADEQARLVAGAERFLVEATADTEQWLGTNTLPSPQLAGYRAAALLARKAPSRLEALPDPAWAEWAALLLRYPVMSYEDGAETKTTLVRLAYRHAPNEVIAAARRLILKASQEGNGWFERDFVAPCWDERLADAFADLLAEEQLGDAVFGDVLGLLIERSSAAGLRIATELLADDARRTHPNRALQASASLLHHHLANAWPEIWQTVQNDQEYGRNLFLHLAYTDRVQRFVPDAESLADLYIWLMEQFPPEEDPVHEAFEAHAVDARESLGRWRDEQLTALAQLGTPAAVAAVERIVAQFPERPGLRQVLLDAEERMRQNTWIPLQPAQLLALLASQDARLVQSGQELVQVLLESLGRFQQRLQGQTPQAPYLWEEVPSPRPKSENRLSDYVTGFLRDDLRDRGIIINREVEIVQRHRQGTGERVDIQVEAFQLDQSGERYDILKVMVEVKGCWNPDLFQAMESQLYEQYMLPASTQYGIYLVGWYDPADWDEADRNRRQRVVGMSPAMLRAQLDQQAAQLHARGGVIEPAILDASLHLRAGP